MRASSLQLYQKRDFVTDIFLWILRNFKEHFFLGRPLVVASQNFDRLLNQPLYDILLASLQLYFISAQETFTCSKSTTETVEKGMKCVHVNNKSTRMTLQCSVFIVNFEHFLHLFLVFLFTLSKWMLARVFTQWLGILVRIKILSADFLTNKLVRFSVLLIRKTSESNNAIQK